MKAQLLLLCDANIQGSPGDDFLLWNFRKLFGRLLESAGYQVRVPECACPIRTTAY